MKIINSNEFNETIETGITLVDFFAEWCGPCKMMGPVLEELSNQYSDVEFVKVNIDDNMDLAERFQIMSIPTVYIFKDGQVIGKNTGYNGPDGIKQFIDSTID